jgi:tetratricopeptide (TPR) repeat protein
MKIKTLSYTGLIAIALAVTIPWTEARARTLSKSDRSIPIDTISLGQSANDYYQLGKKQFDGSPGIDKMAGQCGGVEFRVRRLERESNAASGRKYHANSDRSFAYLREQLVKRGDLNGVQIIDRKIAAVRSARGQEDAKRESDLSAARELLSICNAYYSSREYVPPTPSDCKGSIANFTRAIEIDPQFVEAYIARARAYACKGENDLALRDFSSASKIAPRSTEVYFQRGNFYLDKQNYTDAIADYSRVIKIQPNSSGAYNQRGIAKNKLGNESGALADFKQAVQIDPNNSAATANITGLYQNARIREEQRILNYMNGARNAQQATPRGLLTR